MSSNGQVSRSDWIRWVVEEYETPLIRYAVSLTNNLDTARDVVQDTFLRLCAADLTQIEDHLLEWLFTVCRNRALDVYRKENRLKPLDDHHLAGVESSDPSPVAALERRESAVEVMDALKSLSPNHQEVVRLKFQHGLSYQEISNITQLSVSNVGFILHIALRKLRRQLSTHAETLRNQEL